LGDCDTDNERGLYIVDSTIYNNDTLTITAAAAKSTFANSTDEMAVDFTKPSAVTTKRAVTQTFLGDFPDELTLSDSPVSIQFSVAAEYSSLNGSPRSAVISTIAGLNSS
jgi:hypothetical protein